MAEIREHEPVLLFLALFSRYDEAIQWGRGRAREAWGEIALESEWFSFRETQFYENTMGSGLKKVLLAFSSLVDPGKLPQRKLETNHWEHLCTQEFSGPESRPLNLDPGYVTEAKLVLASTKDRDHRIYLSRGIFAENTLFYREGAWRNRPWTYPDYQRSDYHHFLDRCRDFYRRSKHIPGGGGTGPS
ncbi:MAG: DUF4416 family protein [Planctomycetota bacterium]